MAQTVTVGVGGLDVDVEVKHVPLALALLRCDIGLLDVLDIPDGPYFTEIILMSSFDVESLAEIVTAQGLSLSIFSTNPTHVFIDASIIVEVDNEGKAFTTIHVDVENRFVDILISALGRHLLTQVTSIMDT